MASEALERPLNTIYDPATCVRKGLCPVTSIRGQNDDPLESHSLYFELHGSGPERLVFIMGLNSTSFSWAPQVEHFSRSSEHTLLVFDNRGVGNSDTPRGPYTTSGMAEDVVVLLDYIGWSEKTSIHIIGASLGGMIALELASRIPERMISLYLAVTNAGGYPWNNLPPWKGFYTLARLLTIRDQKQRVAYAVANLFPTKWLDSINENDPEKRTNREIQREVYYKRVSSARLQKPMGVFSQMYAGLTHHVSAERLRRISSSIPKVLIVTGDDDNLVNPRKSEYMKSCMPEAEFVRWLETGHALHLQWTDRFNELIERVVREGRERLDRDRENDGS